MIQALCFETWTNQINVLPKVTETEQIIIIAAKNIIFIGDPS
jgi:hypothetical protein